MRFAAGLEYNGAPFYGWQTQDYDGLPTVQAHIEKALSFVADHPINVVCAGRTDAGVHATQQVIHFDTDAVRAPRSWLLGANTQLPPEISVLWVTPVSDDFHARYSATARRYHYFIANQLVRPAIGVDGLTWHYAPLDAERMHQAAQYLLGEHDFNAYRAVACQAKHARRNVHHIKIERRRNLILIDIQANAFLHHMVRNIVGVLMEIGEGKRSPIWAQEVLASRDRKAAGVTAPAQGLYMVHVVYEDFPLKAQTPIFGQS